MKHRFLPYKESLVSYYQFGKGAQTVLCFHGYGETGEGYQFLEKYAGNHFSFISIDLPLHGQTKWENELDLSNRDLQQIILEILRQEGVDTDHSKLILTGFSLGGRIALSLYECNPEIIEKMILLAPDGLKINAWYWLATQTWLGNRLFRFTMKHPGWFFAFLKLFNKMGLVNTSIFKFVNYYIGDPEARKKLYERWTGLRKLRPGLKKIKSQIRERQTPVRLVYGKHDRIILPARGEKFKKGIEEYCTLNVINSGHQVLHEKHAAEIMDALYN